MFPEKHFDQFLATLSLAPFSHGHVSSVEVVPKSFATDGFSRLVEPAVRVWYREDLGIKYDSFVRKLDDELRHFGHGTGRLICGPLLYLYTLNPDRVHRPTQLLNQMLQQTVNARVAQSVVFAFEPPSGFSRYQVGDFTFGEVRIGRLKSQSRNAGSDFFDRYRERLVGRFAIERLPFPTRVIDWEALRPAYALGSAGLQFRGSWNRGIDSYFAGLAENHFTDFWESLAESHYLVVASGAPYISDQQFRNSMFAEYISAFLDINDRWGHVYPGSLSGLAVDFASADKRVPKVAAELLNSFGLNSNVPLTAPLRNFAEFVAKGIRYGDERTPEESLLHFVIAWELLFGEKSRTAESVSRRVATVVHLPLGRSLEEAENRIDKLYDARSRYVHAGRPVSPELLPEAKSISRELLWSLLRRMKTSNGSPDILEDWTKQLDYIYSALVAGRNVPIEDLAQCGIASIPLRFDQ